MRQVKIPCTHGANGAKSCWRHDDYSGHLVSNTRMAEASLISTPPANEVCGVKFANRYSFPVSFPAFAAFAIQLIQHLHYRDRFLAGDAVKDLFALASSIDQLFFPEDG